MALKIGNHVTFIRSDRPTAAIWIVTGLKPTAFYGWPQVQIRSINTGRRRSVRPSLLHRIQMVDQITQLRGIAA